MSLTCPTAAGRLRGLPRALANTSCGSPGAAVLDVAHPLHLTVQLELLARLLPIVAMGAQCFEHSMPEMRL